MIQTLPGYISLIFILTTLLTLILLYICIKSSASHRNRSRANQILVISLLWILFQSVLAYNNFFNIDSESFPPRLFLAVFPALFMILIFFVTKKGRRFIDRLPLKMITWINIVRIPVELVLYWLFLNKAVPELMTFAGRNFDILAGITTPIIIYFGFRNKTIHKPLLLTWNIISLLLLLNIIISAVLSAPFFIQMLAFDQPNIAILYFPFNLLPTFIVPVVLFGHFASIRLLTTKYC